VVGSTQLIDDLVQRVVGHLQLVQLAEELLLEALQLLDLCRGRSRHEHNQGGQGQPTKRRYVRGE
jgi:hypothetical protein